ncbi:uncharacterized protein LOC134541839 [Bacillus rossius redtenbacheri]|uniref:uncharacterized protein LOC134541839 n=1 Tax=Bacillus rossius redtenbacheri TaxID=93214 RepID=UPI002FDE8659
MEKDKRCMALVLSLMRLAGLWPSRDDPGSWRTRLEGGCARALMVVRALYIASMTHVYRDWGNLDAILDSTPKFCTALPLFVLAAQLFARRAQFEGVVADLRALFDDALAEEATRPVVLRSVRLGRQLAKFAAVCLTMLVYYAVPLVALANRDSLDDVPLPLDTWFPLERSSRARFFVEYGYHVVFLAVMALQTGASHLLCFSLVLHIGSLFDVAGRLALAIRVPRAPGDLRRFIALHQRSLEGSGDEGARLCLSSVQSARVSDAVYFSDWLARPPAFQKALLMATMRAQRPVHVTAGKFGVLSFETFASVSAASSVVPVGPSFL